MEEMAMIKLVFSDEEKDKLFKEYRETMNPKVRNKLLAVYLKSLETEHLSTRQKFNNRLEFFGFLT